MRVSQVISAPNWRYAVGELALIVAGVLIALAATSWYEDQVQRRDEILILEQLRETLSDDLRDINAQWEITRERERYLTALVEHLESGSPYTADLGVKFQALIGWRIVKLTTGPFEALKVQGYRTISNASLRDKLIAFYEDHYARLEYNLNLDRDFAIEKVQPYFFRNFLMDTASSTDVDGGVQAWVPIDYDKIRSEQYIANLCRFRADLLRRFALQQYGSTTAAMHDVLEMIDQELANAE